MGHVDYQESLHLGYTQLVRWEVSHGAPALWENGDGCLSSLLPWLLTPSPDAALTCVNMMVAATSLGTTSFATVNSLATRELPAMNVSWVE